jgi:hypothetical protein
MTEKIMNINSLQAYLSKIISSERVIVREVNNVITLEAIDDMAASEEKEWDIFMSGVHGFSDDFTVERLNDAPENRVEL